MAFQLPKGTAVADGSHSPPSRVHLADLSLPAERDTSRQRNMFASMTICDGNPKYGSAQGILGPNAAADQHHLSRDPGNGRKESVSTRAESSCAAAPSGGVSHSLNSSSAPSLVDSESILLPGAPSGQPPLQPPSASAVPLPPPAGSGLAAPPVRKLCRKCNNSIVPTKPSDGGSLSTAFRAHDSLEQHAAAVAAANLLTKGPACACPRSSTGVRKVPLANEAKWRVPLKLIAPYLDVRSMLTLRLTSKFFHRFKYNPQGGILRFWGFHAAPSRVLCEEILPAACRAVGASPRTRVSLDFSKCVQIRDASAAIICEKFHRGVNGTLGHLVSLNLDFCHRLSDKGLEVLLTTQLPYLESISFKGARSKELTGVCVPKFLSAVNWPRLTEFSCAFTNFTLLAVEAVSHFIGERIAVASSDDKSIPGASSSISNASPQQVAATSANATPKQSASVAAKHPAVVSGGRRPARVDISGSLASRCLMEKLGLSTLTKHFCEALHSESVDLVARLSKRAQQEVQEKVDAILASRRSPESDDSDLSSTEYSANPSSSSSSSSPPPIPPASAILPDILLHSVRDAGSRLFSNVPLLCNAAGGVGGDCTAVKLWTLPLCVALEWQNDTCAVLQLLIKRGAEVEVTDYLGDTVLVKACKLEQLGAVELLLRKGANPNPLDNELLSPLGSAIRTKNEKIIELLLSWNARIHEIPHCRNSLTYRSPLCIACDVNCRYAILRLLELGANPNWCAPYNTRVTPSLLAFKHDSSWLEIFLKKGVGAVPGAEWILVELLSCSISKGNIDCVRAILCRYSQLVHFPHALWSYPHIQASKIGRPEILELCLFYGGDVSKVPTDRSSSGLHAAAEEGHAACAGILLDHGCSADLENSKGQTPLHVACVENREAVVTVLLEHCADVNRADASENNETPLMKCIKARHSCLSTTLLDQADTAALEIDKADGHGRTALSYSLFYGQYQVAEALIGRGADVDYPDNRGQTPRSVIMARLAAQGISDEDLIRKLLRWQNRAKKNGLIEANPSSTSGDVPQLVTGDYSCIALVGDNAAQSHVDPVLPSQASTSSDSAAAANAAEPAAPVVCGSSARRSPPRRFAALAARMSNRQAPLNSSRCPVATVLQGSGRDGCPLANNISSQGKKLGNTGILSGRLGQLLRRGNKEGVEGSSLVGGTEEHVRGQSSAKSRQPGRRQRTLTSDDEDDEAIENEQEERNKLKRMLKDGGLLNRQTQSIAVGLLRVGEEVFDVDDMDDDDDDDDDEDDEDGRDGLDAQTVNDKSETTASCCGPSAAKSGGVRGGREGFVPSKVVTGLTKMFPSLNKKRQVRL